MSRQNRNILEEINFGIDRPKPIRQLGRLGSRNNQQSEKQILIDSIMNKTNSKSEKQILIDSILRKQRNAK